MFGMKGLVEEMVTLRRMRWLGHVARVDDRRMPKQALFGRLSKATPFHGVKMRWKDRVIERTWHIYLQSISYLNGTGLHRKKWCDLYHEGIQKKIACR